MTWLVGHAQCQEFHNGINYLSRNSPRVPCVWARMRPCRNLIWRKILRRQKGYSFYRAAETLKGPKHRCFWAKGAPVVEVQESAWFRSKGSWARVKFALLSIRKITVYFRRATATASPLMRRRSSRCSLLSGVNLALAAGSSDRITISPRPHVQR